MSVWTSVTPQLGLSYPGIVDTVKLAPVGTIAQFRAEPLGGGEFIYLSGAAGIDPGDVCQYQIDYSTLQATATVTPWAGESSAPLPLCVATAATVAGTWGWYQISGSVPVNSSGSVADGDPLYWQAPGIVSATPVTGLQMLNAVAASASGFPTASKTIVTIDRPLAQGVIGQAGIEFVPSPIGSAIANTLAIQAAADRIAALGTGGVIRFPPGIIPITANPATQVSPDQGMGIYLEAQHSSILFQGCGKGITIFEPASNEIEIFVQDGATNIQFEDFTIDNSANGALQNQVAPVTRLGPGTGIAGHGNSANCGIRQYEGADLTVRNCSFFDFIAAISYIGSFADDQVVVGTTVVDGCDFDACIQGFIPEQPEHIRFINCRYDNGVESVNADASVDPGHAIYLSNRPGAYPYTVTCDNIQGINNWAELVKIRKGFTVVASNLAVYASQRGIEFENCMVLAVTNCSITMADIHPADDNGACVFLADNGVTEIGNISMDTSNSNSWGIRTVNGGSANPWANQRMHVHDISHTDNKAGGSFNKDWNVFTGQDDLKIENFNAYLTANIAANLPIINVTSGARPVLIDINRRAESVGSPVGSDRLAEFGAGVTDGRFTFNRTNVSSAPTANTLVDAGTDTIVMRNDGVQSGTYLPVVSFATLGDFVPTYTRQQGYWTLTGDLAHVSVSLIFSTNAYTTAAGNFQISLPPQVASTAGSGTMALWGVGAGNFQNIVFGANANVEVLIPADLTDAVALLRIAYTANSGGYLTTTSVPASTADIAVTFQIFYKITET